MKIAVFHNLSAGGAKRVVYEQVKALARNNEIYLFELSTADESFLNVRSFCKQTFRYSFNNKSRWPGPFKRINKDFKTFCNLRSIHKKIAEDINKGGFTVALIHTDRFCEAPYVLRYLKIPNLYFDQEILAIVYAEDKELENLHWHNKFYELLIRYFRRGVDLKNARCAYATATTSKFMQRHIEQVYKRRAKMVYPGVSVSVFRKIGEKKHQVLFVGGRTEKDGYFMAKKVVAIVNRTLPLDLKIAGIKNGRLSIINDSLLTREYSESLAILCTSKIEAFGLKAIEAMACETPVIAVKAVGYIETVINNKTGYLLRNNPKEFAEKIIFLARHPEVVERMGKAGREHVQKNFKWEEHNRILEQELLKISRK